jgi:asparagine synthase (glutamine-hydrolysing)
MLGVVPSDPVFDGAWAASNRGHQSPRRSAMITDTVTYLPGAILTKVDRASMAISLETRAPMLDHRLIELALRLPQQAVVGKRVLKAIAFRHVPRALIDRPKAGFAVPLASWFRGPLKSQLLDTLTPQRLKDLGIIDAEPIRQIISSHLAGTADHSHRLWALLVLSLWLKRDRSNPRAKRADSSVS